MSGEWKGPRRRGAYGGSEKSNQYTRVEMMDVRPTPDRAELDNGGPGGGVGRREMRVRDVGRKRSGAGKRRSSGGESMYCVRCRIPKERRKTEGPRETCKAEQGEKRTGGPRCRAQWSKEARSRAATLMQHRCERLRNRGRTKECTRAEIQRSEQTANMKRSRELSCGMCESRQGRVREVIREKDKEGDTSDARGQWTQSRAHGRLGRRSEKRARRAGKGGPKESKKPLRHMGERRESTRRAEAEQNGREGVAQARKRVGRQET